MKFVVYSLGCKVNQYEGLSIIRRIKELGHEAGDKIIHADVYVINSCSVTGEADSKSRQLVSRFSRLNPDADILICGCSSQIHNDYYAADKRIKLAGGTSGKLKFITDYIEKAIPQDKSAYLKTPDEYETYLFPFNSRTRSYIKIQDGCNNFCSYCIVPYARGRSRSRELGEIYEEINNTVSNEIIFTGINLSDYKPGIGSLIKGLSSYPDKRFRLSSIEPNLITEELLKIWKDSPVCEHFHMSLQSGSDSVLKKMNRRYSVSEYLNNVALIRKYFDNAGITTDVIAGFPTETVSEHEETLKTISEARFSDMHVFPYSEREGTKAYTMKQVPVNIRRARAAEITGLSDNMKREFLSANAGRHAVILAESNNTGYTSNYIKVYPDKKVNESSFVNVILKSIYKDGMSGAAE